MFCSSIQKYNGKSPGEMYFIILKERCGHRSVAYKESIYILGGHSNGDTNKSILHRYNVLSNSWSQIMTLEPKTEKRNAHVMLTYKHYLFVFSGVIDEFETEEFVILKYDFETTKWEKILEDYDIPGRYAHSGVRVKNFALIFGGDDNLMTCSFNDTLIYDFNDNILVQAQSITNPPSERSFHTAVLSNSQSYFYIFGGICLFL
jgi:N-acetylneuraminic acid mutarotase